MKSKTFKFTGWALTNHLPFKYHMVEALHAWRLVAKRRGYPLFWQSWSSRGHWPPRKVEVTITIKEVK